MKTTDVKRAFAALAVSALSFSAFAGVSFTWTGAAGNNLYSDNRNWSISGETTHKGPDWTDDAYVKTDDIGHDVTIIMDTANSHPNIFQTTGSHKVTINAKDESYQLSAYHLYLEAADHEFNIKVYQYEVCARNFPITRSATFNRDVSLNDSLTINNRSTSGNVMNAIHFYGTLKMKAGCVLGLCRAPWTDYGEVHFHGPLICDELRFGLGYKSGYAYFYSQENQIGKVGWCYSKFICRNENVFPSSLAVTWPKTLVNPANGANEFYWESPAMYNAFDMSGHDQTATMVSYEDASYRPWIVSGSPAVLTLNGSGEAVATVNVGSKVSIAVDSSDLVQEFRDSQSTMEGVIDVKQGAFKVTGNSTFSSVPEILVGAGSTFELSSTATGAMGCLTNVTVASGGTFKVGSGVASPFGSKLAVNLADGAFIDAAVDLTIPGGLWVDGQPVPSDTYESAPWKKGAGKVTVNAPNVAATYVWTGLGGDRRMTTAANWQGNVKPLFTSTLATYVFPLVGTASEPAQILVDTAVSCQSINFTSGDEGYVQLVGENGGKVLIVNGGLYATNTTGNAIAVNVSVPIDFSEAMKIRAGTSETDSTSYYVSIDSPLNSIGQADLTKEGYGALRITGDGNVILGNIHNYQGSLELKGANPVGGGTGYTLLNYPNKDDRATFVTLTDATVDRNVNTRNPSDSCGPTIRAIGPCAINGAVNNNAGGVTSSGHLRFHIGVAGRNDSVCTVKGLIYANNSGFIIVTGTTGTLKCERGLQCVRPYCDVPGSTLLDLAGKCQGLPGSDYYWFMMLPVRISADNCVYHTTQGDQYYMCYSGTAGIDLNGHKLTLANFGCDAASYAAGGCYIKGGEGSQLTLAGDANDAIGMHILEEASLVRAGTGTTTIADKCSSTGTLKVTGGTVAIVEGGRWQNCARVSIGGGSGAAKVKVAKGRGFGKNTVLSIDENGTFELDEGVSARVGELWIDEVKQPRGIYGSAESGAGTKSAYFAGKGTLTVGDPGLVVLLR